MPYFHFTADHDHRIPGQTTAYKAGWTGLVTTACAKAAESAGRGRRVAKPRADKEVDDKASEVDNGTPT